MSTIVFVLGGRRSGKSRFAQGRASDLAGNHVTYVATARTGVDVELDARVAEHRRNRPAAWSTREVDLDLAAAVRDTDPSHVVLIDSLTLWASSVIEAEGTLRARWSDAEAALRARRASVVLVSEEAGMGVVPLGALSRTFLDELGWLNQQVAALANEVDLMVAGIPVPLKGR